MSFFGGSYLKIKKSIYKGTEYLIDGLYQIGYAIGVILPPCEDKLVQYVDVEQQERLFPDETGVLIDFVGESGSEVNRPEVGGWYFEGDGTRRVDLESIIALGNKHGIEFRASIEAVQKVIMGNDYSTTDSVQIDASSNLRYRGTDGVPKNFPITIGSIIHTYKFVREPESIELFIDGSSQGAFSMSASAVININLLFDYQLFANRFVGKMEYIKFTYDTDKEILFTFEEGNQDTRVLSTNPDVYGLVQNSTGDDRKQSTAIASDADTRGFVESDGATFYYDELLTELIPAGKIIPLDNDGVAVCWVDDGS